MDMHEDIGKILLTEEEIKARVRELGRFCHNVAQIQAY